MRKNILIILLLGICCWCHAQDMLFNKYTNNKGVNIVAITKATLQMVPNLDISNANIKNMASKIDYIRIMTCERQAIIAKINQDALNIYKKAPWQEMMRMNEGKKNVKIYMRSLPKNKNEFAMHTTDNGTLTIVNIAGNITLKDFQKISR